MKISSIKILGNSEIDGLSESKELLLGNIVVLAGKNGSGKTRLIKRLERYVGALKYDGKDTGELSIKIEINGKSKKLSVSNANCIELVNYSHYDAQLQSARKFTPYTISKSKELLHHHDYGVTALNALLLLEDMSHGYSQEFKDGSEWKRFIENYVTPFDIRLTKDFDNSPKMFGLKVDDASLSPGQRYLLRMAVACYCNEQNEKVIFILDEPELHLHPQAQIRLLEMIRSKFPDAQLWISTHSLALISFLTVFDKSTTLLYMSEGNITNPRSDLNDLLHGLVGSEENLFSIRQLLCTPEEYVCNRFAVECMGEPDVSEPLPNNPQNQLMKDAFKEGAIILDYGAGKCRMLEEMESVIGREKVKKVRYYAYDPSSANQSRAKEVLSSYGFPIENYYDNKDCLYEALGNKIDCVFLVNVLHEIPPTQWEEELKFIQKLLKTNSSCLVIVERAELTIGEAPYQEGFLMLTPNGANELWGAGKYTHKCHSEKKHIVAYIIGKHSLDVSKQNVRNCVNAIGLDAKNSIVEIKSKDPSSDKERFKNGLRLAFYLNQFANASLISDKISEVN